MLAARGYDYGHALHRSSLARATYQNMTVGDIAKTCIGGRASRSARSPTAAASSTSCSRATRPTGTSSGGSRAASTATSSSTTAHAALPQGRRRGRHAVRARVGRGPDDVPPARHRRAAGRRGRGARLGPGSQEGASTRSPSSRGRTRARSASSAPPCARRSAAGTLTVADRPVVDPRGGHDALAESLLAQLGNAYLEAEGTPRGDPRLRAGARVRSTASASASSGDYPLASTTPRLPRHDRLPDALHDQRPLAAHAARPRQPVASRARSATSARRRHRDPERRPGGHGPRARDVPGARRARSRAGGRAWRRRGAGNGRGQLMMPLDRRRGARRRSSTATCSSPYVSARSGTAPTRPATSCQTRRLVRAPQPSSRSSCRPTRTISVTGKDTLKLESTGDADDHERNGSIKQRTPTGEVDDRGPVDHDQGLVDLDRRRAARSRSAGSGACSDERQTSSAPASPSRCGVDSPRRPRALAPRRRRGRGDPRSSSAPRRASARCGPSSAAASTTTSSSRSTPYTLGRIDYEIRVALDRWEPRIDVARRRLRHRRRRAAACS